MIKVAEMLFKAPESEKPTILMLIDRNELQDQLICVILESVTW
ncbi:MAG: hypothetical protein U0586_15945 [Candidatus Brocadiaceae bacterium]